ncbi:MAG: hypothetical protein EVA41_02250 [Flavobacteriales bacterium]|nr:MAG: hypothetical protein EVA41_02250 [Flavobacteriales bacterium]CAI8398637.1 MAG: Uncharacterised protein [Flavobacteriales bacterium]
MKKKYLILCVFFLLVLSCAKSDNSFQSEEIVEEEFIQDYSCVNYDDLMNPQTTDRDDLLQYWNKFVDDVKCTSGGPDFAERTKFLKIFFEYTDITQTISGITPNHLAYSSFVGYCNDERVNIGVLYDGWSDLNLIQRLWVMYHEFGHDVFKYEHSTDPADIMYPSSTRSDIDLNDFIRAKDRMFKRSFPGIRYISCPQTD